jgi:mannose-6-phosphate isomerase-like protein (cupin superfamily)
MNEPVIAQSGNANPIAAIGNSFEIHEWTGSGPGYLHVHFADDEAWHILDGALTFRFGDKMVEAPAGTTVFVPAGVPHDYFEANGSARYLVILTPRLHQLIDELHKAPLAEHAAILRRYESAIAE